MGLNPGFRMLAEAARALHSEVDLDHLHVMGGRSGTSSYGRRLGRGLGPRQRVDDESHIGGRPARRRCSRRSAKASSLGLRLLARDRQILAVDDLAAGTPEVRDLALLLPGFSSLLAVPVPRRAGDGALAVASPTASHFSRWTGIGVILRARVDNDDIVVEVEDDGAGLTWPYLADEPPDPEAEEGRGCGSYRAFCDGVSQQATGTGTVVRCLKLGAVLNSGADSGGTGAFRG